MDDYKKLFAKKIGPVDIIEKINPNAYRLKLPSHIRTTDIFNVEHLIPYVGDLFDEFECFFLYFGSQNRTQKVTKKIKHIHMYAYTYTYILLENTKIWTKI